MYFNVLWYFSFSWCIHSHSNKSSHPGLPRVCINCTDQVFLLLVLLFSLLSKYCGRRWWYNLGLYIGRNCTPLRFIRRYFHLHRRSLFWELSHLIPAQVPCRSIIPNRGRFISPLASFVTHQRTLVGMNNLTATERWSVDFSSLLLRKFMFSLMVVLITL